MFNFLKFGRGKKPEAVIETQRQTFERLIDELNASIAQLPVKPAVTLTPTTGALSFDLPDQFPDEALALPAPTAEELKPEVKAEESKAETASKDAPSEATKSGDTKAEDAKPADAKAETAKADAVDPDVADAQAILETKDAAK